MREQFEKLPEIAESLSEHIYFGSDNLYHSSLINFQGLVNWLNGAYYAFQEQQKKIDAVLRFVDGYDSIDIENSVNLRDCVNEIEELLK